jgi:hypothetical protein
MSLCVSLMGPLQKDTGRIGLARFSDRNTS